MRAEREHYFDGGIQQVIAPGFKVGIDAYYKIKRPARRGTVRAVAGALALQLRQGLCVGRRAQRELYARPAGPLRQCRARRGEGTQPHLEPVFFAPDELAYIADHSIFTDHSQRWTASGGASVTVRDGIGTLVPTADFLHGGGLRANDPAGIVPNGGKLPSYFTANLGIAQNIDGPGVLKGLSIRFDVTNVFDKVYLLRDGSGVGVGAPQYGARRGFFAGVRKAF